MAQPVAFTESFTTTEPAPAAPQLTVIEAEPCPEAMVPPVTVQV